MSSVPSAGGAFLPGQQQDFRVTPTVNGTAVALVDNTNLAIIAALPTVDPADGVTVWNDNGVPKVASAS